jgi:hypothetical protein
MLRKTARMKGKMRNEVRSVASQHGGPVKARGRLFGWDQVQANNAKEYPDPALPTYEHCSEWVPPTVAT